MADQLGGFTPGEFVVAIGDGSVRTLRNDAVAQNKAALSHLVEIADGNIVQFDDLTRIRPPAESANKRLAMPTANRFAQPVDAIPVRSPATPFKQAVPKVAVPAVPIESPPRIKDK